MSGETDDEATVDGRDTEVDAGGRTEPAALVGPPEGRTELDALVGPLVGIDVVTVGSPDEHAASNARSRAIEPIALIRVSMMSPHRSAPRHVRSRLVGRAYEALVKPCVVRTMLATGLAGKAVDAGYRTYFTTAADLAACCHRAAIEGRWATSTGGPRRPRRGA